MKKLFSIVLILMVQVAFGGFAHADHTPAVTSAVYDGLTLAGTVEGAEFVRATFFLRSGDTVHLYLPVTDGQFTGWIDADCVHITLRAVDTFEANVTELPCLELDVVE